MSEWFYIQLAFGLSWAVLAGYAILLVRRSRTARKELRQLRGGIE